MAYNQYGYDEQDIYSNPMWDFNNVNPNTGATADQSGQQTTAQPAQTSTPQPPAGKVQFGTNADGSPRYVDQQPGYDAAHPAATGMWDFGQNPSLPSYLQWQYIPTTGSANNSSDPGAKSTVAPAAGWNQTTGATGGAGFSYSQPQAAAPTGGGGGDVYPGTQLPQDPRFNALVDQLMQRAGQSLQIDPKTDSVIRPQVDAYQAQIDRNRNKYLDQMAEAGSPYGTGALDNAKVQTAENAGIAGANLESSLTANELTNRRTEIQNALQESGSLLTASQQMKLQEELGLLDASLKKQQIQSGNDQFLGDLGLRTENQNNYWNAVRSGQILG